MLTTRREGLAYPRSEVQRIRDEMSRLVEAFGRRWPALAASYPALNVRQDDNNIFVEAELPGNQLAALLAARGRRQWKRTRFYRLLGAMLFDAAEPTERYRVFERFYRLREGLIERFYAARPTLADRARVLAGKPPVPVGRALAALAREGAPLQGPPQ